MSSPFEFLGLTSNCDIDQATAAYQRRLLLCRPDDQGRVYTEEFRMVQDAFRQVTNVIAQRPHKTPKPKPSHNVSFDDPRWNDPKFRKDKFVGDTVATGEEFQRQVDAQLKIHGGGKRYTTDDLPAPMDPKRRLGLKGFSLPLFNALFDLAKGRRPQEASTTVETFQEDDGLSSVAEHGGLLMIQTPGSFDTDEYADVGRFNKEAQESQVLGVDNVTEEDLRQAMIQRNHDVLGEAELMQRANAFCNEAIPRSRYTTKTEAWNAMNEERQTFDLENDAKNQMFIRRNMHVYPMGIQQQYTRGRLARTRTLS